MHIQRERERQREKERERERESRSGKFQRSLGSRPWQKWHFYPSCSKRCEPPSSGATLQYVGFVLVSADMCISFSEGGQELRGAHAPYQKKDAKQTVEVSATGCLKAAIATYGGFQSGYMHGMVCELAKLWQQMPVRHVPAVEGGSPIYLY